MKTIYSIVAAFTFFSCFSCPPELSLGDWQTRHWKGVLPAADGSAFLYTLTVRNREHSGDGTFVLVIQALKAENGEDSAFSYTGKRFTQRGMPDQNDATIWQMVADDGQTVFNFLCENEETLILLNDRFEKDTTGLNGRLILTD